MDLITSHVNADFDALASMVAASKLYPSAVVVLSGGAEHNVKDFLTLHEDLLDIRVPREVDLAQVTRVILVDCQSRSRLGELAPLLSKPGLDIHVYDHHPQEQADFEPTRRVYRHTGATVTLLLEEIQAKGLTLEPVEATLMALGLYEDTGSFGFSATTAADLQAGSYLMSQQANLDLVAQFVHPVLSEEQRRTLAELVESAEHLTIHGVGVAISLLEAEDYRGEIASLAHRLADIENAETVFIVARTTRQRSDGSGDVLIVGRTAGEHLNIGGALQRLGGGGHRRAGSATLRGATLAAARERLVEVLGEEVRPEPSAADIMSQPPRTVQQDAPIEEVARCLQRYGHSGLSVMDGDHLVGVITRRDVDKARHHRLTHAPAKGFMTRPPVTAVESTPLSDLMQLMLDQGVGRLPILREGSLVGVVTRGDLLMALHGRSYAEPAASLAERMEEELPERVTRLLHTLGEEAGDVGVHAYLVGGFVRDLLLGIRNLDVDVVVEGEAALFAGRLATTLKAEVKGHERFGTAKVVLPDGFTIDVATARCESYPRPAALPEVEVSSLRDDLRRRDFSLNAMAVSLGTKRFGDLIDPFGGWEDLRAGRVRVLHNLSFVDDPTRVLRGARFAGRFGFELDPETRRLAMEAVAGGSLAALTPERLRRELINCLQEERVVEAFRELESLGVLRAMDAGLTVELPDGRVPLACCREALTWFARLRQRDKPDRLLVLLAGLLAPLGPEKARALCLEKLRYSAPRTEAVAEALAAAPRIQRDVADLSGSSLTRCLRGERLETLVVARALGVGGVVDAPLEEFITRLRHCHLGIGGRDLQELGYAPSPAFGRVLEEALDAKLDGGLRTRKAELAFAAQRLQELTGGI
ncbi:MAG TPA: CBS domain-containing protein [Armatimonadota bacterium]|jgi:tRNA nucleotidyltransferase (CCA-adding enzyme)